MTNEKKRLRVMLVKSTSKKLRSHQASVRGLGLTRIGQEVELKNTPAICGMIKQVSYLLKVEEI